MTNREYVTKLAKMYAGRSEMEWEQATIEACKVEKEENMAEFGHIDFYQVGRNASHDFYLGVDENDNAYYRSYSAFIHMDDPSKDVVNESCHKEENVQDPELYIGHW